MTNATPIRQADPGSISYATMRPEDLIPRFTSILHSYRHDGIERIEREYDNVYTALDLLDSCPFISLPADLDDDASYLTHALFDALEEIAPDEHYFGSHPGDGANYGFFPVA